MLQAVSKAGEIETVPAVFAGTQLVADGAPARIVPLMERGEQSVIDPDGRRVVFDAGSHLHLAQGRRSWLLDHVEMILTTVARPDYRAAIRGRDMSASSTATTRSHRGDGCG